MPNKYMIVTGTQESVSFAGGAPGPREDIGFEIECDVLTIEPSGAITVWKKVDDFRSVLMQAFGPHEWKRVDYRGWEEPIETTATEPPKKSQT